MSPGGLQSQRFRAAKIVRYNRIFRGFNQEPETRIVYQVKDYQLNDFLRKAAITAGNYSQEWNYFSEIFGR